MTDELSDNEQLMLARENAADNHVRGQWYAADERGAFIAGRDAAMEYVNTKLAEGVGHLDKTELERSSKSD